GAYREFHPAQPLRQLPQPASEVLVARAARRLHSFRVPPHLEQRVGTVVTTRLRIRGGRRVQRRQRALRGGLPDDRRDEFDELAVPRLAPVLEIGGRETRVYREGLHHRARRDETPLQFVREEQI